uniref:Uncharacterized protein n=1 Tax=mine drainage metagenome TaxID=410659 RepID=E6PQ88_9ZZZZ
MNVIDRITKLGLAALQPNSARGPASVTLSEAERRIEHLQDDIQRLQAEQQAEQVRRQSADVLVAKLTDQAATGKLKDPTRLTEALRQQREMAPGDDLATKLQAAQAEKLALETHIHEQQRQAAKEAYLAAVARYAQACAPLRKMGQTVQELAPAAGVMLTSSNSQGLIGAQIQIGGALIDVALGKD